MTDNITLKKGEHNMFEALSNKHYIIGSKQVKNAVKCGKAKKVYIASDSDSEIIEPVIALANECGVEVSYIPTRSELGKIFGINVKSACAADLI